MTDISVQGVVKAYELDKNILDGLSFEITAGERVGLLGKNGAGKTTLFKLLVGELEPDEGNIVLAPGKRVGLISQIPVYPPEYTTEDVLRSAHAYLDGLRREMERLEREMASNNGVALLREYDTLQSAFESRGGYSADTDLNKVANGLQISAKMRGQLFSSLSGGEKTRVNLARLILENTDILLLDEPTNHLDLRATEWLEDYLLRFKGTVLAISHDRYFLDTVAQRVIEVVKGKAEYYSGNYSFYVVEKQRRYDEQLKKYEAEQKEVKRLSDAADRLYQWGTGNAKLMKKSFAIRSRIDHLAKTDRPDSERRLGAEFRSKDFHGDEVVIVKGLTKSYDGRQLFAINELLMQGGERIALIGDNGTGKSTFIKLLMGEEEPDAGYIRFGPSVKSAYLPQIIKFRNPYRSVLDMMVMDENLSPQSARNRLGAFKFSGEDVFKPISALSGGEQSRLRLCALMKDEINLLILDEPTNHLDIQSREWIEEALEDYAEALLFVSHDRYFISRFATRIWELKNGTITDFKGTFEQYRAQQEAAVRLGQSVKSAVREKEEKPKKQKPQDTVRLIAKLERDIEAGERRVSELDTEAERSATDYARLMELDRERETAQEELYALYEKWGELTDGQ